MKLNVGCGKDIKESWVNLDMHDGPGVDVICDVDTERLPFPDSHFDKSLVSHLLEHLHNPLFFMEELWRVTKPDGICRIHVPHGASDEAWEDQTHLRPYYPGSFAAFGQPYYHRADYGYVADWEVGSMVLQLKPWAKEAITLGAEAEEILIKYRNVAFEIQTVLTARKPVRPQTAKRIEIKVTIA